MALPDIMDDAVTEILLRLPPDEPAWLFCTTLVCKLWRGIISHPAFSRRYCEFHRKPPLLGFFHSTTYCHGHSPVPRFVPTTTAANPFPRLDSAIDGNRWCIADCHHGRVLVEHDNLYVVWDPITGHREELHKPADFYYTCSAAVLCAVAGCDHRDCQGGRLFKVIFFYTTKCHLIVHACVYSSVARAWGSSVSTNTGSNGIYGFYHKLGALIGNVYYCNFGFGRIVKYQLGSHCLSMIDLPKHYRSFVLMPMEDRSLGCVGLNSSTLYLWEMNPDGTDGRIQLGVIDEIDTLLSGFDKHRYKIFLGGSAEGIGLIYIAADGDLYTLDIKSRRARKLSGPGEHYCAIFSFMSFYTPGR